MARKGERHQGKDPATKAKAILECVTLGDAATCKKYRISLRTLQRWHQEFKAGNSKDLAASVAAKKAELDKAWASQIPESLSACFGFITYAAKTATANGLITPEMIHSISGAIKIITDTDTGYKFIDARISGQVGGSGAANKPLPSGGNVTPIRRTGS